MEDLIKDILERARQNAFFREVLLSGSHTQVVVMSIPPGGEIGEEIHSENDQILLLVEGEGKVILNGGEQPFEKGDLVLVRAGTSHNFINSGSKDLKIITTYSPPHHPQGTVHKTKEESDHAGY